jgi:hypothetical protein
VDAGKFLDPHLRPPDPPLHPSAETALAMAAAIEPVLSGMMGDAARPEQKESMFFFEKKNQKTFVR